MKKTGGQAFPAANEHDYVQGMTLRDYFAAHAPDCPEYWTVPREQMEKWPVPHGRSTIGHEVIWRYAYADAMLAERDK